MLYCIPNIVIKQKIISKIYVYANYFRLCYVTKFVFGYGGPSRIIYTKKTFVFKNLYNYFF